MSVKLSAKWQLDAALLSRPVDLTALVTLSRCISCVYVNETTDFSITLCRDGFKI